MHSKGNHKRGEKTVLRREENNSKSNNWRMINFQNIQAVHTSQYQKTNKTKQKNQKEEERPKPIFLQRRHTDG